MSATAATTAPAFDPSDHPHRRYNPLTGKHVLVSPHRTKRPWKGQTEEPVLAQLPHHDPACYLCPGNSRSGGTVNPKYEDTFVFENDFAALLPGPTPVLGAGVNGVDSAGTDGGEGKGLEGIFDMDPVRGRCKVICYHPRHDLTLARMDEADIVEVVKGWQGIYKEEGEMLRQTGQKGKGENGEGEGCVQIFENRGSMMGASAPHPHGQVWSLSYVPDEPAVEIEQLSKHPHGNLLQAYAAAEVEKRERVVELDESGWVAVVPFWATWPFEILLLPYKRHIPSLLQLSKEETDGLSRILKRVLVRYDNLFSCPFPYSMGIHQSPLPPLNPETSPCHLHYHFYPPLLRSASVRKFLVGFEMMGEAQRDLTPEQGAARLRGVSGDVHYADA